MYPAIENACQHLKQFIDNKIESGQNILYSKDVCIDRFECIELNIYSIKFN